jgi:tetrahydromethanopterin S-methyltransferase subunit F
VGASTARRNGGTTVNQEKAGHVSNGLIGTIIGVLVVVILVIVILQLT